MTDQITIALLQHVSTPRDLKTSIVRMRATAKKARDAGAELLLFPEASLTGYNNSLKTNQQIAQEANGEYTRMVAEMCREFNIAIAYGFAERDGNQLFNSVQLIDETGSALALYRKTHLWGDQDRTLFSRGENLTPIVNWHGWNIGLLICYDIEFPENVRRLALEGADIVLTPTALMSPHTRVADQVVPVRAYENQVFIAYANFCGTEFEPDSNFEQHYVGHSCIVGPDGNTLAKADTKEVLLIATLDHQLISTTRSALPYHRDRRPSLYKTLVDHDD